MRKPFDLVCFKNSPEGTGVIRCDEMARSVRFDLIDNADSSDSTLDCNHVSSEISTPRVKVTSSKPAAL